MEAEPDEPCRYAVRLYEHVTRDINEIVVELAESVSINHANEWKTGLKDAFAGLAAFPRRYPLTAERFRGEVRHLVYRRYRVFFTILNEDVASEDPPTVVIMGLRHVASRPLTRREISQIEAGE